MVLLCVACARNVEDLSRGLYGANYLASSFKQIECSVFFLCKFRCSLIFRLEFFVSEYRLCPQHLAKLHQPGCQRTDHVSRQLTLEGTQCKPFNRLLGSERSHFMKYRRQVLVVILHLQPERWNIPPVPWKTLPSRGSTRYRIPRFSASRFATDQQAEETCGDNLASFSSLLARSVSRNKGDHKLP